MASPIPIRNVYFLLLYAWDQLAEGELTDVSELESTELADLFASVLVSGIHHVLRRGLDQGYLSHNEEIAGVRGRINIGITARRMLMSHGRAHCEFDELSVDTRPNQILRAAVTHLIGVSGLDSGLKYKLRGVNRELGGISTIPLRKSAFRDIQLHSNNRYYRFLLNVCELICSLSILDEQTGDTRFRDFLEEDGALARLFESFVFNFYRIERPDLNVRSERIAWDVLSSDDPGLSYLPSMKTDISLRSGERTLIIDTKFYQRTFQRHFGKQTIHSGNLYQIYAYLKNLEPNGGPDGQAAGMLLYPTVNEKVRLSFDVPGHRIQICTVDLEKPWQAIREELLGLIEPTMGARAEIVV